MYDDLTNKELEILFFLKDVISKQGFPPSIREICEGVGLKSPSSVHGYLERLEQKDYIVKTSMKNRTIALKDQDSDGILGKKETIDVPLLGKVTAGEPIFAVENIEDTFPIPSYLAKDKDLFMLRISGESMINAGILDGDYVLIEKRNTAKNGDIVLALIDEFATVKRFYYDGDHYRLQPENDSMEPIYTNHVEVLGHIIGLYRNF